jgi:hypothetical protein
MAGKMINIFQVIKNRSKIETERGQVLYLYPNCIDSILNSIEGSKIRYKITICDFESNDFPLEDWLPQKLKGILDYEIIKISQNFFDKGIGLNISRNHFSNNDFIFYLDVDNQITKNVINRIEHRFEQSYDSVGFLAPIYIEEDGSKIRRIDSVGNLWIRHKDLSSIPPWINMDCWGGEDTIFLYNCLKSKLRVYRETDVDIYHQWHPAELRNKYYRGGKPPKDDYAQAIRDYYKTGFLKDIVL